MTHSLSACINSYFKEKVIKPRSMVESSRWSAKDLLFYLLEGGWEWKSSETAGYMDLCRGDIRWSIDPFDLDFYSLLHLIQKEAYERGKKENT